MFRTLLAFALFVFFAFPARAESVDTFMDPPDVPALAAAAEKGDAGAQYELAEAYFSGRGVPQDYTQAAAWFRKAADQGNVNAQFYLGGMYGEGNGVPKSVEESYFWYSVFNKTQKNPMDLIFRGDARGKMAQLLTREQILAVEKRVAEWKPVRSPPPPEQPAAAPDKPEAK